MKNHQNINYDGGIDMKQENRSDNNDIHRYDDIINLLHHQSNSRPRMSILNRAAQFSSFAALTGYEDAIEETARLTDKRIDLDESTKSRLDEKLRIVQEQLNSGSEITITYFKPDNNKPGGLYVSLSDIVKKIDYYERAVVMQDGTCISIDDIINITGGLFNS